MLDGTVVGECLPRHRHQEFLKFLRTLDREFPGELELHLIVDDYRTHKHANVDRWLARHPRFQLHFGPSRVSRRPGYVASVSCNLTLLGRGWGCSPAARRREPVGRVEPGGGSTPTRAA